MKRTARTARRQGVQARKEHQWLEKLVGEWTYEVGMDEGGQSFTMRGTEKVTKVGGLWVLSQATCEIPGMGKYEAAMTIGYDARKKRFVGSWVDNIHDHLWVYDGELDASGKVLTLNAEGPAMDGSGKMGKFRDIFTIEGADVKLLTSQIQQPDGSWKTFGKGAYKRKK